MADAISATSHTAFSSMLYTILDREMAVEFIVQRPQAIA